MKNEQMIETPYCGLRPFETGEQAYFFGREQETLDIVADLLSTPLTLLFGPCGVGKTSLLKAGVISMLNKQKSASSAQGISPSRAIIYYDHWREQGQASQKQDVFLGLKRQIKEALQAVLAQEPDKPHLSVTEEFKESLRSVWGDSEEEQTPEYVDTSADLSSVLTATIEHFDGDVVIILDQFEKYLSHPETKDAAQHDAELIEAISHPDPRVSFLISMREENLEMLNRFIEKIPHLFTSSYRLNALTLPQARDVIQKPLETYNRMHPDQEDAVIEIGLIEQILVDLSVSPTPELNHSEVLKAGLKVNPPEVGVEAAYLQLILSHLWKTATEQDLQLGLATYKYLGGISSMLAQHLENAINRQDQSKEIAAKISLCLIDAKGEKSRISPSALAKACKVTPDKTTPILTEFVDTERILRPLAGGGCILFQEHLISVVSARRKAYEQALEDAANQREFASLKKQAKKASSTARRFRKVSLSLAAMLIIAVGATLFAFWQEAQESKRIQVAAMEAQQAMNARKQAELEREQAEAKRKQAEIKLVRSTSQAKKAEIARKKAEKKLKQAQTKLVLSKSQVKKAEIARKKAEAERKRTENKLALAALQAKKVEIVQQRAEDERKRTTAKKKRISKEKIIEKVILANNQQKVTRKPVEIKQKKREVPVKTKSPVAIAKKKMTAAPKNQVAAAPQIVQKTVAPRRVTASQPRLGLSPEEQLSLMLEATKKPFTLDNALGGQIDQLIQRSSSQSLQEKTTLRGHAMKVTGVTFSPDGSQIATASADKTVIVWDAKTGQKLLLLAQHDSGVNGVHFSPDGSKIATASSDRTAKIWNVRSGDMLFDLKGHTDDVTDVVFDVSGNRIITASKDKTAKIWDAQSKKILHTLSGHTGKINHVVVSSDGKWIATASADKTARIWDQDGLNLLTLEGHSGSVNALAFSPDGKQLATVSSDKTTRIWDPTTGKVRHVLKGHQSTITGVAFSPDGKQLATTSWDKTTKIWDTHSAKMLSSIRGHNSFVSGVVFSPDGKQIVTTSLDKTAKIWDQPSVGALFALNDSSDKITGVVFSPDGKQIATTDPGKTAKLWDADSGKMLLMLEGHQNRVISIAFSSDGKRIATASEDKTAKIWDRSTGKVLVSLEGHSGRVSDLAFSPNGKHLATVSADKTAKIWDVNSGKLRVTLPGHQGSVVAVVFSPDGKHIATTSADKTAKIWEVASGKALHTFVGHKDSVTGVAFSPDGRQLATTSADHAAKFWDAGSGKGIAATRQISGFINGIAFSNVGRRVVTADSNKRIQVYALNPKELVAMAQANAKPPQAVR